MTTPSPVLPPSTTHKAWVGAALAAASTIAGLLVGAMALVNPEDVTSAINVPTEQVHAWWRIILAILTVLAGAGVTGGAVYQVRNQPKP
jgi:hypothetical protein